jgi:hypothetical protein
MRKQFCAYTKCHDNKHGMRGGAALRNALVHAESIEDYRRIISPITEMSA